MSVYNVGQQFVSVSTSTIGNNTIVAAVTGKKIRVMSYALVCAAAETVQWKSSTTSNISGAMSFAANGGISAHYCPIGVFQTVAGEALTLNLTTGGAIVSGHLVYTLL